MPDIRFLLNEAIDLNNKAKNINDLQKAADYFLKSCYNVRINYEKHFMGGIFMGKLNAFAVFLLITLLATGCAASSQSTETKTKSLGDLYNAGLEYAAEDG